MFGIGQLPGALYKYTGLATVVNAGYKYTGLAEVVNAGSKFVEKACEKGKAGYEKAAAVVSTAHKTYTVGRAIVTSTYNKGKAGCQNVAATAHGTYTVGRAIATSLSSLYSNRAEIGNFVYDVVDLTVFTPCQVGVEILDIAVKAGCQNVAATARATYTVGRDKATSLYNNRAEIGNFVSDVVDLTVFTPCQVGVEILNIAGKAGCQIVAATARATYTVGRDKVTSLYNNRAEIGSFCGAMITKAVKSVPLLREEVRVLDELIPLKETGEKALNLLPLLLRSLNIKNFYTDSLSCNLLKVLKLKSRVKQHIDVVSETIVIKKCADFYIKHKDIVLYKIRINRILTVDRIKFMANILFPVLSVSVALFAISEIVFRVVIGYLAAFVTDLISMISNPRNAFNRGFHYVKENTNRIREIKAEWKNPNFEI
jgi:hypothetical protein